MRGSSAIQSGCFRHCAGIVLLLLCAWPGATVAQVRLVNEPEMRPPPLPPVVQVQALELTPPPKLTPQPKTAAEPPSMPVVVLSTAPVTNPLPINLPTALQLANVRPLDVALASTRLQAEVARQRQAQALWLPTIYLGTDYARHDGQLQDIEGKILPTGRSSFMVGAGPSAVFAVTDAIFAPLAARQDVAARRAVVLAAQNDSLLAVADAYFTMQQARGEMAGVETVVKQTEELVRRAERLAEGLVPPLEVARAKAELARLRQGMTAARERYQVSSSELCRLLRLEGTAQLQPLEAPHLRVYLIDPAQPVEDLVEVALHCRPELAAQQALVRAVLERMRQEKLRPFLPSLLVRGNATNPAGTLSSGLFGGGINGRMGNFDGRNSFDVQLLWELQNLGFGNRARLDERRAEHQQALLALLQTQDRVAAEVIQAHAMAAAAADRAADAEEEVKQAVEVVSKSFEGLSQTRRIGEGFFLVIRPQEVVAALQALDRAYRNFYAVANDHNRAQFRLYRALGQPADHVTDDGRFCPEPITPPLPAPAAPAPR